MRRQKTVAQFIDTQSILDLCEETYITPGGRVNMRWWEQAGIDLTRYRGRVLEVADADEDGGETVTGEKRNVPGLGQRQIKVQRSKIN